MVIVSNVDNSSIAGLEVFVKPLLADMGLELVEIQLKRESHGLVLRIFIDAEQGIAMDDCVTVSRQVSAFLDVEDLIESAYTLEVSSPGAERPLVKKEDYERFKERKVRVKLIDPLEDRRVFTGTLKGLVGESVVLQVDDETVSLELHNIKRARLSL